MPSWNNKSQIKSNDPRMVSSEALPIRGKAIQVLVGPDQCEFSVHQDLISNSSDFFRRMMASELFERYTGVVGLPEDDPLTFECYVQWLYTGKILCHHSAPGGESSTEWTGLVQAYILGDKLLDTHFKDTVIDAIVAKCNTPDGDSQLELVRQTATLIYANTTPGSPLRRLVVDNHVRQAEKGWYEDIVDEETDPQYLFDLVKAYIKVRSLPRGRAPNLGSQTCTYHEHAKDLQCHRLRQGADLNVRDMEKGDGKQQVSSDKENGYLLRSKKQGPT